MNDEPLRENADKADPPPAGATPPIKGSRTHRSGQRLRGGSSSRSHAALMRGEGKGDSHSNIHSHSHSHSHGDETVDGEGLWHTSADVTEASTRSKTATRARANARRPTSASTSTTEFRRPRPPSAPAIPPFDLSSRDGLTLPLRFDGFAYEVEAHICGTALPLAISTTRRSIAVCEREASARGLVVRPLDRVCEMPRKGYRMVCGDLMLLAQEENEHEGEDSRDVMVAVPRCDFCLCGGAFRSRVGLLGRAGDRRSIFAQMRVGGGASDCFALLLMGRSPALALGSHASRSIPRDASRIPLHELSFATGKGALVLPLEGMRMSPTIRRGHGAGPDEHLYLRWSNTLPAVVHAEVPELVLPPAVLDELLARVRRATGAFGEGRMRHDFPDNMALRNALRAMPNVRLFFRAAGGGVAPMRVSPWQYVRSKPRRNGRGVRAMLMLAASHPEFACCVLGNCALDDHCVAFSRRERSAWVWQPP
jgi:hypothetical protein